MKIINDLKWSTIGTVLRTVLQVIQISVLTRFLDKEEFGIIAIALFFIQFSQIFAEGGFTSGILHHANITKKEKSSLFWLINFISFTLFLMLWICTPWISEFYEVEQLNTIVPLLALNLIFFTLGRISRTLLQKNKEFKKIAVVDIIAQSLAFILSVYLAINEFGVYSLVYPAMANAGLSSVLFLISAKHRFQIKFYFAISETIRFFKIGVYTLGGAILDFISRELDILIIGKYIGLVELGVYSLCKQIVTRLYAIVSLITNSVLVPHLVDHNQTREKLRDFYMRNLRYLSFGNFALYLFIVVAANEILFLLYGEKYSQEGLLLGLIATQYAIFSVSNPSGGLQIATGKTYLGFRWTVVRVLTAPLVILLTAPYGIIPLVSGMIILSLIYLIGMWYMQIKPMIAVSLITYLKGFAIPLGMFAIIAGASKVLLNFQFENTAQNIGVALLKGLAVFFILICTARLFAKQDYLQIRNVIFKKAF